MARDVKRELLEWRDRIETAKAAKSEAEGALKQAMDQLMTRFGCKTIKEAEAKMRALAEKGRALEAQVEELLTKLETEHGAE